jgi:hypothetical protein
MRRSFSMPTTHPRTQIVIINLGVDHDLRLPYQGTILVLVTGHRMSGWAFVLTLPSEDADVDCEWTVR